MRAAWLTLAACLAATACAAETPAADVDSLPVSTVKTPNAPPELRMTATKAAQTERTDVTIQTEPAYEKPPLQVEYENYVGVVGQLEQTKVIPVRVKGLDVANEHFGGEIIHESPKCYGDAVQGGLVVCHFRGLYEVDGLKLSPMGPDLNTAFIGLDRDAGTSQTVKVWPSFHGSASPKPYTITFEVAQREFDTSRIDGLPPSQVSTFNEAQLKRIRSSSARKKVGFSSRAADLGFNDGFISPVTEYRKTTNFGAQRILNGEPKKPHYGVDMAAPVGTPIYAPADGVVSLADEDLYFEGAMVLLDHGQGLISMYLHVDETMVEPGQHVKRGEQIATVGSKGRSTGPHLCWRLKWRNRNLDPELLTQWSERAETTR